MTIERLAYKFCPPYFTTMLFKVISSPLDGDFDPVAQFYWNLTNGFAQYPKEFDGKENSQNNVNLINNIRILISKFEAVIETNPFETLEEVEEWIEEDGKEESLYEVLNLHWNPIVIRCAQYTQDSADALCELLVFLKKFSSVFKRLDEFYDFMYEFVDIFSEPQFPREVIWHLIDMFEGGESCGGLCSDEHTPYLLLSIGRNSVIGDRAYLAHLKKLWGEFSYTPSTFYDAYKNPSLTITSLSELPEAVFGEYVEFIIDQKQYNWDLHNLGARYLKIEGHRVESSGSYPNFHFALVVARIFDEVKLGRVSWEDLILSDNKYFRTIAFYNPKTDIADKSRLLKTELEEMDSVMLEFLSYSFAHPHISALSLELAQKSWN